MRYRVTASILLFFSAVAALSAAANVPLPQARSQYDDAVTAIDRGTWTEYARLRPVLDHYPLAIYLDYREMVRNPAAVRPAQANQFLQRSADSPLPNRFLAVYLKRAGRDRRWADFLAVKPDEPNSIELKCYYFRAQLAQGSRDVAWEGAARLWVYGRSQPKACDPLFKAWMKAGQLNDTLVWQRLLAVFDARQSSLLRYVARQGSPALKPWSDTLQAVYRSPERIRRQSLPADQPYAADIAAHGLAYLARYKPEKALEHWQHYQQQLTFSNDQAQKVIYRIVLEGLFDRSTAILPWMEQMLAALGDDELVEIRLRWALAEQDWPALERNLALLSQSRGQSATWRYWRALALQQRGEAEEADAVLRELATERGYYGFLSAQRVGLPYAFEHDSGAAAVDPTLHQLPAVVRVGELTFHAENNLAQSEWHKLLGDNPETGSRQAFAQLASDEGWHRMAIDAANKAEAWDRLDLRFPMPYSDVFERYASARQVSATELMSIARRESAFFPQARSPVGARGLMQIMPATGKQLARGLGQNHRSSQLYEVEHNVLLGSAYYRELLDRYQGNRIFALAAYNAGPHRVDRWKRPGTQALDVEAWVETIPFRETRNYVQAVLSYNVVFNYLQGKQTPVLSDLERRGSY